MSKLYTVREEVRLLDCPYTEHRLRILIAQGLCPGVRVGNRFMIDHDLLVEQVKAASMAHIAQEATG